MLQHLYVSVEPFTILPIMKYDNLADLQFYST